MKANSNLLLPSPAFPVLGKIYTADQYLPLDLSITYKQTKEQNPISHLQKILAQANHKHPNAIPYGGYMERRGIYMSEHFGNKDTHPRCIHLGVDLWAKTNTPIYAPFDGKVHSYKYNAAKLDYGYTIILEHSVDGALFYSLYGHLSDYNFDSLSVGKHITRGQIFCKLGSLQQNGGWPPHLHFQIIKNLGKHNGDYPGVSTEAEAEKYSHLCPDPTYIALGYQSPL